MDFLSVTTIVDMVGSALSSIVGNVSGKLGVDNRKKLANLISAVQAKARDNENLRNQIAEWSSTRSSKLANAILSSSGFGSAIQAFRVADQRRADNVKKANDELTSQDKKLDSAMNQLNTAYTNTQAGGIAGLATNIKMNNQLNNLQGGNSNELQNK